MNMEYSIRQKDKQKVNLLWKRIKMHEMFESHLIYECKNFSIAFLRKSRPCDFDRIFDAVKNIIIKNIDVILLLWYCF